MSDLHSSVVSAAIKDGARRLQWGIVHGKKENFMASLKVWGLQYCELCDDLVELLLLSLVHMHNIHPGANIHPGCKFAPGVYFGL